MQREGYNQLQVTGFMNTFSYIIQLKSYNFKLYLKINLLKF